MALLYTLYPTLATFCCWKNTMANILAPRLQNIELQNQWATSRCLLSSLHKAAENEHTLHLQLMSSAMCTHFKQIVFLCFHSAVIIKPEDSGSLCRRLKVKSGYRHYRCLCYFKKLFLKQRVILVIGLFLINGRFKNIFCDVIKTESRQISDKFFFLWWTVSIAFNA